MTVYQCPYNNVSYKDKCPITKCPANIDKKSGCIHNLLNGKLDLDEYDLAFALDLDISKVKSLKNSGIAAIKDATTVLQLLEKVDDKHTNSCPHCGVPKNTSSPCLIKSKCHERKLICQKIVSLPMFYTVKDTMTYRNIHLLAYSINQLTVKNSGILKPLVEDLNKLIYLAVDKERVHDIHG